MLELDCCCFFLSFDAIQLDLVLLEPELEDQIRDETKHEGERSEHTNKKALSILETQIV